MEKNLDETLAEDIPKEVVFSEGKIPAFEHLPDPCPA